MPGKRKSLSRPESFPVPATIFARDEKMWSRHADGIDLLELNCRSQMRQSRMMHLFFFEFRASLRTHLCVAHPSIVA